MAEQDLRPDALPTPERQFNLRFDSAPMKLGGWAAPNDAAHADAELAVSLMAGSIFLGTIRRDRARPDVDAHLGFSGPPVGFAVPDHGLSTFARICRVTDFAVSVEGAGASSRSFALPEAEAGGRQFAPLGTRHGIGKVVRLVDLWFENGRDLSLRFDGSADLVKSVDAYQCGPGGALVAVATDRRIAGLLSIVGMTLVNPFAPLLLIFKGDDQSIDAIDFLPFPSLARGGAHAAERLIAAHGADDLADTATLSAELVGAWLQRLDHPEHCVAAIELDPAVHTGLEPGVNDDLLSWLAGSVGVSVRTDPSVQVDAFIAEVVGRHQPATVSRGHVLHLPADCIPTIAALLRPLPADARAQKLTGSMGIVDWNRHGRLWSVWLPQMGPGLEDLQLARGQRFAPLLSIEPGEETPGPTREVSLDWPLALALRNQPSRVAKHSPFETPPESEGPLLRNGSSATDVVSVLVLADRHNRSPLPLVESLVRQEDVQIGQVILCRPHGSKDGQLVKTLGRLLRDRHAIVPQPATAGALEQICSIRDKIAHDRVVVLDSATVLPDARTLATLVRMLHIPDVASAGCLMRAATDKMTPLGAGYSLTQVNLLGSPAVGFDVIDSDIWRGPATYPVVANTLSLLVTRRGLIANLSAAGSAALRPETDDLLMGIALIEGGGFNLCTTLVSGYSSSPPPRRSQAAISLPYRLSPQTLVRIAESATLVQRIT